MHAGTLDLTRWPPYDARARPEPVGRDATWPMRIGRDARPMTGSSRRVIHRMHGYSPDTWGPRSMSTHVCIGASVASHRGRHARAHAADGGPGTVARRFAGAQPRPHARARGRHHGVRRTERGPGRAHRGKVHGGHRHPGDGRLRQHDRQGCPDLGGGRCVPGGCVLRAGRGSARSHRRRGTPGALSEEVLSRVADGYRDADGRWVGASGTRQGGGRVQRARGRGRPARFHPRIATGLERSDRLGTHERLLPVACDRDAGGARRGRRASLA